MAIITAAAVAAVGGAIASGIGASSKAKAIKKSTTQSSRRIADFTDQFTKESKALKGTKLGILGESENVFDRLGGFVFGDTDTLSSLRKAQSDFSSLAAGDTSGFTREVESIIKSALAGTFGSPKGAFENLSAKNLFNFRSGGLQNALSLTNNLSSLGSSLINTEFSIHDQDFENRLRLRENEANQLNALSLQAAGVRGTNAAAVGNVLTTAGNALFGVGNFQQNQQLSQQYNLGGLINQQGRSVSNEIAAVQAPQSQASFFQGTTTRTPIASVPYTNPFINTDPVDFRSGGPYLYNDAIPPLPQQQYQFPDFYSPRPDFRFYQNRAIDNIGVLPPK
jgi:hypothetical protein